jgi:putative nucleotidyltransferase with HDIG domain
MDRRCSTLDNVLIPEVAGIDRTLITSTLAEIATVAGGSYSLLDHSHSVARRAVRLAQAMGLDRETVALAYVGGLLHDAGKTRSRHETLFKAEPLTDAEKEHLRAHPANGVVILRSLGNDAVLDAVLHHHECFDGSGYPFGLRGTEIPLLARLVGVADYYEALRENRVYRAAFSRSDALAMLEWAARKGKLDPRITRVMTACGEARRWLASNSTPFDRSLSLHHSSRRLHML